MDDIAALLDDADEELKALRGLYQESLGKKESWRIQPRVKNILESHRSALDYLAVRIYRAYGAGTAKVYYPVATGPAQFPTWFEKNLPGIATVRPDIKQAIQDRQPWEPGYDWLGHLHELRREQGHNDLTPQTRAWDAQFEINPENPEEFRLAPGALLPLRPGETISVGPFYAGDDPNVDPSIPRVKPGETIQVVVFEDWLFDKPQISVLATLETIQRENRRLITEVRQVARV